MSEKYKIDLPVSKNLSDDSNPFNLSPFSNSNLYEINAETDVELKKNLEKFARYFKKEMRYDNVPYDADNHQSNWIGYLFKTTALDLATDDNFPAPTRWFGGCLFKQENEKWTLCWIWLHPFFRNRGELGTAWTNFEKKYGDFKIQEPLSAQMEKFLIKRRDIKP